MEKSWAVGLEVIMGLVVNSGLRGVVYYGKK